ncbi:methyl-accepting chemotaxis protein [Castellaniella sp.]|uniref:methyl-accepting chemotaxis protein n=1 Tax=Castellaniella sp. TaxID=1955812 RepID=UPI002B0016E5|nr:methyl-accepting chemotaxis protein [Castellaniella sp.]
MKTLFHRFTLRQQLMLIVACIVIAGFAITLTVFTRKAAHFQLDSATRYGTELARSEGMDATEQMRQAVETARTLTVALDVLGAAGAAGRAQAVALVRQVLQQQTAYLSVRVAWESNAFGGHGAQPVGAASQDTDQPYQIRLDRQPDGSIVQAAADRVGQLDAGLSPQKTGDMTVSDPTMRTEDGRTVLVATISAPIFRQGVWVGAVDIDIDLASLQQVVSQLQPFETGYASLLSNQGYFAGDRDSSLLGERLSEDLGLSPADLEAALSTIAEGGTLATRLYDPLLKTEATVIQVPVYFPGVTAPWAFAVTLPNDQVLKDVRSLQWLSAGLGLLSVILTVLCLSGAIGRLVLRPLGGEPAEANRLVMHVAQGDLTHTVQVQSQDDFSLMYHLRTMQSSLIDMIARVRTGARNVATASGQINSGNLNLSARTEQQASSLAETAATMEEFTATVRQNADNARQANTLANNAAQIASNGGVIVAELVGTMGEINGKAQQVVDIISVIDSIAFQTNILALNAAVEAARAGEQGRGFAVVASEVRALAQRSASAAKEIKLLIEASVASSHKGNEQADHAGATMQEIVAAIHQVTNIVGEISAASREQASGIEEINTAIMQMDGVTRQNASLVEHSATAAASLQTQADTLLQLVSSFQLHDDQTLPIDGAARLAYQRG